MKRPFDLIVFDWDGTLMDSTHKICHCIGAAALDCGIPDPGPAVSRQIIGLGLTEALRTLFPTLSVEARHQIAERYRHHFIEADTSPTPLFPGVREGLERLKKEGYHLAVATGKSRRGLEKVMAESDTRSFFGATRCADECRSKPDPLMLEQILQETGIDAGRALMVGDTTFDMEMAVNANMPRVAVSYGAHDRSQLLVHEPLACVDEFTGLWAVLA